MVSKERASFRQKLDTGRGIKMVESVRQMDWTRHSKWTHSRRRPAALSLPESWLPINHNQREWEEMAHQRHQQQTFITKRNVMSCSAVVSSAGKTTSGKQQKISAAACKVSRAIHSKSTSTKGMKLRLMFCRPPLVAPLIIGISAALIMFANEINLIVCDTDVRTSGSGAGNNLKLVTAVDGIASREQGPVHRESVPNQRTSVELSAKSKKRPSMGSSTSATHKERILSSLMDSIERQHMKLSPGIRSLALARPSKFDSGNERLREAETGSIDNVQINTRSSHHQTGKKEARENVKTLDDIMNQHYGQGAKKAPVTLSGVATSKADQELLRIMMLHEKAVPSHTVQLAPESQTASASRHPNIISKHLARFKATPGSGAILATNSTPASNQLWSVARSPLLGDATDTSKVLTNVASLLSPVALGKKQARANSSTPFTPRLNGKSILLRPLVGLGQMFAPDIKLQAVNNKHRSPLFAGSPGETQATYVLSNAINQPQGYSSVLKGWAKDKKPSDSSDKAIVADASSVDSGDTKVSVGSVGSWIKIGANQLAQSHSLQDSFRDLLTLSQLPILLNGPVSTAPSELEPGGKKYVSKKMSQQQQIKAFNGTRPFDDIFRYAYILANLAVRRKRDPLKVLEPSASSNALMLTSASNKHPFWSLADPSGGQKPLVKLTSLNLQNLLANRKIKPRGVMWDMATDPSLAVTVFHLLERVSVALPLGFLLMPFVHMIRNPLNGINLGRIIPARASHRSVDYEELARKINSMDKMLSRALRPTHRELPSLSFVRT